MLSLAQPAKSSSGTQNMRANCAQRGTPMTQAIEAAKRGECETCGAKTHHGPWTDEQISEVLADTGIEEANFIDWCDECLVREVGQGDLAYTEQLLERKMVVKPKPSGLFALIAEQQAKDPK